MSEDMAGFIGATNKVDITRARDKTIMNPMDDQTVMRILTDARYIVNITDLSWQVSRSFGYYAVRGLDREKGEKYTVLEVNGRILPIDFGDDKAIETENRVELIAEDIAQEINGYITAAPGAKTFMGVFVSKAAKPSAEELADAHKRLMEFQKALAAAGDSLWDDPKTHKEISNLHRWAARALNMKRDWLYESQQMDLCRACGETIKPNIAKCPKCHATLDYTLLKVYFPLEYAELEERGLIPEQKTGKGEKKAKAA